MTRRIDLDVYPLPHPPLLEWLRANGVDTSRVPIEQVAVIENDTLSLDLFVFEEGRKLKRLQDGEPVFESITVPLISAPENHGL